MKPVAFLPVTGDAMNRPSRQFAYKRKIIPNDVYGPGSPSQDVLAVDYSDWLMLTNAKVPDPIAYTAARPAVEDRVRGYEALYTGEPDRQRSADIPVKPERIWKNVRVPLHPGAERYYREAGVMP